MIHSVLVGLLRSSTCSHPTIPVHLLSRPAVDCPVYHQRNLSSTGASRERAAALSSTHTYMTFYMPL